MIDIRSGFETLLSGVCRGFELPVALYFSDTPKTAEGAALIVVAIPEALRVGRHSLALNPRLFVYLRIEGLEVVAVAAVVAASVVAICG